MTARDPEPSEREQVSAGAGERANADEPATADEPARGGEEASAGAGERANADEPLGLATNARAANPRGRGARSTFLWMGALSVITLVLGVLREFVIARGLRASGSADAFFRGLVIVGACRNFGLALFRARWIPLGLGPAAGALLRHELRAAGWITAAALVGLVVVLGTDAWGSALAWVFVAAVVLAVLGSAVRALAERAGHERLGFVLEWALPLGTIAGALVLGRGALGPALGMTLGLLVGLLALVPPVFLQQAAGGGAAAVHDPARTRWLLLDTLLYVNLGLLDTLLSPYIFDEGGFALLNYGYLFVNAALAVPTAAATVVALRLAADPARARRILRRWAPLAGLLVGAAVLVVWALLSWDPIETRIDAAAGWSISGAIRPLVLASVPFAALRLANTVGRQARVAEDPRGLWPWNVGGLVLRTAVLVVGAAWYGIIASPVALVVGELVQLGAWWRWTGKGDSAR